MTPDLGLHPSTTVGELAELYLQHRERSGSSPRSLATLRSYIRRHLEPSFGPERAQDVIPAWCEAYATAERVSGEYAPATLTRHLATLSAVLSYGVDAGLLPCNPVRDIARSSRPGCAPVDPGSKKVLPPGVVLALISDARIPADRRLAWAGLCLLGVRRFELARLTRADYTAGSPGVIRVRSAKSRRNVVRRVPVLPPLAALLEHASRWAPAGPTDLLFPRIVRRRREFVLAPWTSSTGLAWIKRDLATVGHRSSEGMPGTHAGRHTCVTLLRRAGADERVIRYVTHAEGGRSSFDRYAHVDWLEVVAAWSLYPLPDRALQLAGQLDLFGVR